MLSAGDRLRFTATGVQSQLAALPDRVAHALGLRKDRLARLDVTAVERPDGAAAREVEAAMEQFPEYLWHHSHRTYLWALALAAYDKTRVDEELLYCACLMHDAGLPDVGDRGDGSCFTLTSAERAGDCVQRASWDADRSHRLREAITLHINPTVALDEHGPEAHLLADAATLDGIGRYFWRLHPATVGAVLEAHPRKGFKTAVDALLRAEAASAPECRIAFLYRVGRLGKLLKAAPFAE